MTPEQLDQLRQVIIKANPDLDYQGQHENPDEDFKGGVFSLLDWIGGLASVNRKEPWSIMQTLDEICELRNKCRPIHLADVLLAIEAFYANMKDPDTEMPMKWDFIDTCKMPDTFREEHARTVLLDRTPGRSLEKAVWDLRHGSLDDQTDDCISFLHSLLVKP